MRIFEMRRINGHCHICGEENHGHDAYVLGIEGFRFLMLVLLISALLFAAISRADTTTLNYSQCMTDNVSNQTYCAQEWFDLNITDVRMNATFYLTGPAQLYNETWNVTFNASYTKYNQVLSPDYGHNSTIPNGNVTCVGLPFPAINANATINGNQTYYPPDSRHNLSVFCAAASQADCKENINATLDWGSSYYSSKCGIDLRCKQKPIINDSRTLLSGEHARNAEFGYDYSCQNTTPELMTCGAEKITLADTIRQFNENATACLNSVQGVNGTLNACLVREQDKDKNITRSTELLSAGTVKKESDNRDVQLGAILVFGAAGIYIARGYFNSRNLPHPGGADPIDLTIEEKLQKEREITKSVINDLFDKKGKEAK